MCDKFSFLFKQVIVPCQRIFHVISSTFSEYENIWMQHTTLGEETETEVVEEEDDEVWK